ncbi:glycoside hydrolase family 3 protein [Novosphingobium ginsenosidimutans]|uniref:Glycoside hydrolase family 3 protein n=1 Tax=Novosphingobium ginsenosidimutans TaxID=1176536 RepID=A0A5B8S1J6_9SPHN|nr:glycoside hydrolase family 3 protein [Novosphingobium ginsenosidimutans]QEA15008.1 glycoside hydrolase family 3 protein [Novosphingobium ginsenosidimutans]
MRIGMLTVASVMLVAGCAQGPAVSTAPVALAQAAPQSEDARIADLLARMSLERKVAQLIQPQINSFTAADMERYRFGSYLNGGNGGPYGDEFAPASQWLKLADEMWEASTEPLPNGEPAIPAIWGTDAVHGHTNVIGATIFPHNVGLGATRDAGLVRRIGAATALEMRATGIEWDFSPTIAVARDRRWGRSYESYSQDPDIVAPLGAALIEGLQGKVGTPEHLSGDRVIATAKHFFADGGTTQGVDQGDVSGDIAELKAIHAKPYPAAIAAGVESIMASFNSVNGVKMHGNRDLLTGVLRDEFGFKGMVVGDWNAHGQIPGCKVDDCTQSLLAGLDMYMVPDDWRALHANLMRDVQNGTIPMARLDEAVARVLRMKLRLGLLEPTAVKPSLRPNGGNFALLGAAQHRAVAREAVAKSQVLLKNDGVLPLAAGAKILVTGRGADSVAQASGGWTLTWQGGLELTNEKYFPGATSIWTGLKQAAEAAGGSATLSVDGSYAAKPDVAVVVFGEEPYAEFEGDRKNAVFTDEEGLNLLRKFKAAGVRTVAVFLSGRPLWMNREINAADAFVAAWLPGSEGAGVADVLYGKRPATGRLSFSWPAHCDGKPVNGPEGALFNLGYGLSLGERSTVGKLDETCAYLNAGPAADWFVDGKLAPGTMITGDGAPLPGLRGQAGGIAARGVDRKRQEDAREITFAPGATLSFAHRQSGSGAFRISYFLPDQPQAPVKLTLGKNNVDITRQLALSAGKGWREMIITDACAPGLGQSLAITSSGPLKLQIAAVSRQAMPAGADCSF